MSVATAKRPGAVGRVRSRQAGNPTGWLGRIVGRAMVKDTADTNDHAVALLELREPSTVLEIGFGQGRTAELLVAAGHTVLGVDSSPTMVRQATTRNRSASRDGRASLQLGDGVHVPFSDGVADAALTAHTIYFMPDQAATFRDVARVLRPGASLVVACRTSDEPIPGWIDPDVYNIMGADQIVALLGRSGFGQVEHHPPTESAHAVHYFVARRDVL